MNFFFEVRGTRPTLGRSSNSQPCSLTCIAPAAEDTWASIGDVVIRGAQLI
jgi:hypothetical protein